MKDAATRPLARPGRRDWTAAMIATLSGGGMETPASFVARDFTLDAVPARAVLHVSAQGLCRADLLTPGWTACDDRLACQSCPVAELLKPGPNRLEIWLGEAGGGRR